MNISPANTQSTYLSPETKPLPKHISSFREEKVFENGMTESEMTTQSLVWGVLQENLKKFKYGYQAHLNQEALKELNLLGASPDDMGFSLDEFLSSDTASLCMPASKVEGGGDTGMIGQITGVTSNTVMPVDMPAPVGLI